jgi:hypothetical protein
MMTKVTGQNSEAYQDQRNWACAQEMDGESRQAHIFLKKAAALISAREAFDQIDSEFGK